MVLNVKLQRLEIHHHLSKDAEKLEKSLCARDKAEKQYLMPVIFRPPGKTALKNRHDCEHSSPCHLKMQVKAPSCKEEGISEHDAETLPSSLGQSSFKMVC